PGCGVLPPADGQVAGRRVSGVVKEIVGLVSGCGMAKRKKLVAPYRGKLSADEIARGMNVAILNARRLFDDAKLLFDAKRFPSACSLSILAIEESGKVGVLLKFAGVSDGQRLKQLWRDYNDHQAKNYSWLAAQFASGRVKKLDDLEAIYEEKGEAQAHSDFI